VIHHEYLRHRLFCRNQAEAQLFLHGVEQSRTRGIAWI
jgi:hypothetical protein